MKNLKIIYNIYIYEYIIYIINLNINFTLASSNEQITLIYVGLMFSIIACLIYLSHKSYKG